MSNRANIEDIKKFKLDRAALSIYYELSDTEIGKGMKMKKGNFSSYVNETNPITVGFLKRFYAAWGEKLKAIYERPPVPYSDPIATTLTGEEDEYSIKNETALHLDTLQKNNDILLKNIGEVIASNSILVGTNQKLTDAYLSLGGNTGLPPAEN